MVWYLVQRKSAHCLIEFSETDLRRHWPVDRHSLEAKNQRDQWTSVLSFAYSVDIQRVGQDTALVNTALAQEWSRRCIPMDMVVARRNRSNAFFVQVYLQLLGTARNSDRSRSHWRLVRNQNDIECYNESCSIHILDEDQISWEMMVAIGKWIYLVQRWVFLPRTSQYIDSLRRIDCRCRRIHGRETRSISSIADRRRISSRAMPFRCDCLSYRCNHGLDQLVARRSSCLKERKIHEWEQRIDLPRTSFD